MGLRIGEEFTNKAVGDAEWWRRQLYLAETGNGAVMIGSAAEREFVSGRAASGTGSAADLMRLVLQQRHEEQIRILNDRFNELDRKTDEALRRADERLAEILRTSNRTRDGRAVFEGDDGKFYDENDNEVGADEIDWDTWNPDAWKRHDFQGAAQAVKIATELHNDVLQAKDDLANRPTGEALAALTLRAESLEAATEGLRDSGFRLSHPVIESRATSAAKEYAGYTLGTSVPLRDPFAAVAPPPAALPSTEQPSIQPTLGAFIAPR
jgi:hypothetical protein